MPIFTARHDRGWLMRSSDTPMVFPAGEQHVLDRAGDDETPVCVRIDGADLNDYASAAMWIDLQHQRGHGVAAAIPYLPGARADRGRPFGARVYADFINAMHADRVIALDPHSPVIEKLIDRLQVCPVAPLVCAAVTRDSAHCPYAGIIAPDAGARDRAAAVADALGLPLYQAGKTRDFATGRLTGFTCEPLPGEGCFLVVDDICDGGGTFRGLAEATGLPRERLDLWVTHGVFSGAADRLRDHFGRIHTTDSHPGHRRPGVATDIHPLDAILIQEAMK